MRTVKMLHVEDDPLQRLLIAHHLKRMTDFDFTIQSAESEDEALALFHADPQELVILDFQLARGDGLSCLRRLRHVDTVVPIVAVSGQASAAIAAQLLEGGADDYIDKATITSHGLAQSVRLALSRADAIRRRRRPTGNALQDCLTDLCKSFVAAAGKDFVARLNGFEQLARAMHLEPRQLVPMLVTCCQHVNAGEDSYAVLRPLLLELHARLGASDTTMPSSN